MGFTETHPAGNHYLIRPIDFAGPCQSKVTLRVSGSIFAPYDPEVWDGLDVHKWLYFHGVKNLKVEGGGTINGMGQKWWARSCKTNDSNPCTHAPTAVTFHKCKNLNVRNISLVFGQQMHMAFTQCTHVKASGITVVAPDDSPNTDGIHISASTNVELKDIIISTGDDCVSIVSNSSKIRIKKIVCGPGHGISIGSLGKNNSSSSVEDVIVSGAVLFNAENGVRIKTWQGGRGFARKITFENIWMKNVSNPIIIDQYYCDSSVTCLNQTSAVSIDNITFRDIKGTSATEKAITFACSDNYPCKRLYLENIQIVTSTGDEMSFCWEAYGTSSGLVYPPSCLSSDQGYVVLGFVDGVSELRFIGSFADGDEAEAGGGDALGGEKMLEFTDGGGGRDGVGGGSGDGVEAE
ncbi:probable polygalacturonase at1g80170 [Phtheirospermum japonicum]|uniref:endo-polygalacturonase n=1 Tax=Phtheirospermum japonicum TaxID=374723 RepID=A0A830CM90_9LAMI|nr:probable polygalacturonase at1g80170 [Phtheirospermum japonicum]